MRFFAHTFIALCVANVVIVAEEAPMITAAPTPQRARPGTDVALTVTATGPNLTYRWYRGSVPLDGATSSTLLLSNVQPRDTAGYRVVVQNASGTAEAGPVGVIVTTAGPAEIWSRALAGPYAVDRRNAATGQYLGGAAIPFNPSSVQNWDLGPDELVYAAVNNDNAFTRFKPATGLLLDQINLASPLNSRTVAGFAWGHDGNLYLSNPASGSVTAVNGVTLAPVATLTTWTQPPGFQGGEHIEIAPDGTVMISSRNDGSVKFFRAGDGQFVRSTAKARSNGLTNLTAFARRTDGDLLALDNSPGGAIHRFLGIDGSYAGVFIPGGTGGMQRPRAMCLGEDGVLCIADEECIRRFHATTGEFIDCFTGASAGPTLRYVRLAPKQQPEFVESLQGGTFPGSLGITLSGKLSGTPPFFFQWLRNGEPLAGANRNPLHLAGSLLSDSGEYQLIAWNAAGSATSSVAQVTVQPGRAEIVGLPARVEGIGGERTELMPADVLGQPPFSYQWKRVAGTNLIDVGGATEPTLSFSRFLKRHAGLYRLAISNSYGISTQDVQLVFTEPESPQILDQPLQLTTLAGAPVESPLLLAGRPPLTTTWWLNGVRLTNQFLPAPQLLATGPTSGTLLAVVSNRFAAVTSAPITLRIAGTNLYRQDFNGRTAPGWKPTFSQSLTNENRWGRSGFRNITGQFSLTNAAPLGPVVFGFDVWAQDSWDGMDGIFGLDLWSASVDGKPLLLQSFSNNDDNELPSYFPQRLWQPSGTVDLDPRLGSIGIDPRDADWNTQPAFMGRVRVDSIHRMRFEVVNSTEVFSATFQDTGLTDENWGLYNVYIVRPPEERAWIRVPVTALAARENAGECQVVVQRGGNLQVPVDVRYATQDAGAVGDIDYTPTRGTLHFAPGETEKSIRIPLLNNSTPDPLRSFGVWLLDAGENGVFTSTPFIGIAIQDDESTLQLRPLLTTIPPAATGATVALLERTGDLTLPRTVELELAGISAVFGDDFWITGITTNRAWVQFDTGASIATARYNYWLNPAVYENPMVISVSETAASDGPETLLLRAHPSADFSWLGSREQTVTLERAAAVPTIEILPGATAGTVRVRVVWNGPASTGFELETSVDLVNWSSGGSLLATETKVLPLAANPALFLRARAIPAAP